MIALVCVFLASCGEPQPRATNVLLITADTTRADDLAVYGGLARTPNLRALRDDGVLFSRVYSVAFGTTPSHASLFTSSYARDHGVYDNLSILDDDALTLAEVVASAGMETAAFVSSASLSRQLGLAQGFAAYNGGNTIERRGDKTVDRFLEWLAGTKAPFLAWIHLMDPHAPYAPPRRLAEHYLPNEQDLPEPDSHRRYHRSLQTKWLIDKGREAFDRHDRILRGLYRAEIEFMDRQLGRAIDSLKQRGQYDQTVIVFISDHGENFGEPDPRMAFGHGMLHQHVVRLPLIIKFPGSRWSGDQRDFLVANIDVAPTLTDLLGLASGASWLGHSLMPAVAGKTGSLRDHVVLESAHEIEISVRTERWVYRRRLGERDRGYSHLAPLQLYDLENDPGETRNIYGSDSEQARLAREQLARISRVFLATPRRQPGAVLDTEEHMDALRELGYVE